MDTYERGKGIQREQGGFAMSDGEEKRKYSSPLVVPLGELARGSGDACHGGSVDQADCKSGGIVSNACMSGGTATTDCATGGEGH